jgi:hypothetical protein
MLYSLFDQGGYDEADFCGEWTKSSFPRWTILWRTAATPANPSELAA